MGTFWSGATPIETDNANFKWSSGSPWIVYDGTGYTLECATGTYAVTGATLNALYGRKAICTTGTYAITGKTLDTPRTYIASCTTGAYLVTGAQLEPVYQENVTVTPSVFQVVLVFNVPTISAGGLVYGGELRMFMDLSLN